MAKRTRHCIVGVDEAIRDDSVGNELTAVQCSTIDGGKTLNGDARQRIVCQKSRPPLGRAIQIDDKDGKFLLSGHNGVPTGRVLPKTCQKKVSTFRAGVVSLQEASHRVDEAAAAARRRPSEMMSIILAG